MNETEFEKKQREKVFGFTPKMEEKNIPISKQIPGIDRYDKTLVKKRNEEQWRLDRLNQARMTASTLKDIASLNTKGTVENLEKMIAKYDKEALMIVLALALIKDGVMDILLDFFGIGLIPILGQIPGYFITAVIFYLMWGKGMLKGRITAWVLMLLIGDNLPVVEEFPITTFTVLFAWRGLVKRIKQAESDKERLAEATRDELEEIKRRYEGEWEE